MKAGSLLFAALVVFAGCSSTDSLVAPSPGERFELVPAALPQCVNLVTQGAQQAGEVCISRSGDDLVVGYTTGQGWKLETTAVAVVGSVAQIPRATGLVDPSSFSYRAQHDDTKTASHMVTLGDLAVSSSVLVAAHATVRHGNEIDGAWAAGTVIDASGAMYVVYVLPVPEPPPPEPPPPSPDPARIMFLVGDVAAPNGSERAIARRLTDSGYIVTWLDDDQVTYASADGVEGVVMSKTVLSTKVGDKLKAAAAGIVFWEDNQQKLDMLATIANDGSTGTFWHSLGSLIYVRSDAPAELRAGLSGLTLFTTVTTTLTWAATRDLPATATVVAELAAPGGNRVIYAYDRGHTLADGTPAAGRRVYFGLYDDTFTVLTGQGLALFDAAVRWAVAP